MIHSSHYSFNCFPFIRDLLIGSRALIYFMIQNCNKACFTTSYLLTTDTYTCSSNSSIYDTLGSPTSTLQSTKSSTAHLSGNMLLCIGRFTMFSTFSGSVCTLAFHRSHDRFPDSNQVAASFSRRSFVSSSAEYRALAIAFQSSLAAQRGLKKLCLYALPVSTLLQAHHFPRISSPLS